MTGVHGDGQAAVTGGRYQALLAVTEAIASHRDLPELFHELTGRLQKVVRFDYIALVLNEAATNTMRLHVPIHLLRGSSAQPAVPKSMRRLTTQTP
jgi:hypothetical protein